MALTTGEPRRFSGLCSPVLLAALVTSAGVEAQSCQQLDAAGNCRSVMPPEEAPARGNSMFQSSLSSPVLPYRHASLSDDLQDDFDFHDSRVDIKQTNKCASKSQASGCASYSSSELDSAAWAVHVPEGRGLVFDVLLGVVCMCGLLSVYDWVAPGHWARSQTPVYKESPNAWCSVGRSIHGVIAQGASANGEDSDDDAFAAGLRASAVARRQRESEVNAVACGEEDYDDDDHDEEEEEEEEEDVWGCSRLHLSAAQGAADEVEVLLRGPHAVDIDAREAWGETPLHLAVRQGCVKVCSLLLENGADADATNDSAETALLVAARAGNVAMCECLLAHGAGVDGISDEELPAVLNVLLMKRLLSQCEH